MSSEDFSNRAGSRREFLGSSAKNAAGVAVGMVGLVPVAASAMQSGTANRIRLAVIGVRQRGLELARHFAARDDVRLRTICDVDPSVLSAAAAALGSVQATAPAVQQDFRRVLDDPEIDAVVIATPDHWHAVMTVMACQAGKHVYLEAPLANSLDAGRQIAAAAERSGLVVQCGLQQRSMSHFRSAIEYIRSGRLGRVRLARAWTCHRRKSIGRKQDARPPEGVDYSLWLGPAAPRPFNPNRFHHNWRWFWDYGGGELTSWGVHLLDVARWGLDLEWPQSVAATGGRFHLRDDRETPDTLSVNFSYPEALITWEHRQWSTAGLEGRSAACAFHGDEGVLIVDRGGWKVYHSRQSASDNPHSDLDAHLGNFLGAIRGETSAVADAAIGHVSSGLCHLGNLAFRTNTQLQFDASDQSIQASRADESQVEQLSADPGHPPWQLPRLV